MIAGIFFAAHPTVHSAVCKPFRNRRREKDMIEPHTFIGLPPVVFVIPECPEGPFGVQRSQSVSPALSQQTREGFTALRLNKRVAVERTGWIDVLGSRDDIVVTREHH